MIGQRVDQTPRVMWLLNHTSARKFEVPMLRRLGFEVFTPKHYPDDPNFRSASVDYSEDANLSIPKCDLDVLNSADWYEGASKHAWEIANKYFDVAFFIVFRPRATYNAARRFKGALLWRTYGLSGEGASYSNVIENIADYEDVFVAIQKLGKRFWFAEAYPHLHEVEKPYLIDRSVFLPLGMKGAEDPISTEWNGSDKRILFICPDVGFNPVYIEIYKQFKKDFQGFPYAIGGAQSVQVEDKAVLGYLPLEEHLRNMREMRVMFYHSREPRHIHFHPFEAVKAGMPLVFMGGGILDQFGGKKLPGRCATIEDARKKISRILNGDKRLIEDIRSTQSVLLEPMKGSNCLDDWQNGMARVLREIELFRASSNSSERKIKRIAILCDQNSENKAVRLAQALDHGAKLEGSDIDVIVGVEKTTRGDVTDDFRPKPTKVKSRDFNWRHVSPEDAFRALAYSAESRRMIWSSYLVPDDGINNFMECDLWMLIASEIDTPIVPLKPVILVPDTIAHRFGARKQKLIAGRFGLSHAPEALIVDSEFAQTEFVQCEGAPRKNVFRLPPILVEHAIKSMPVLPKGNGKQFLWLINPRSLPNIEASVEALSVLYNQHAFSRRCRIAITEVAKTALKSESHPNFKEMVGSALKRHNVLGKFYSITEVSSERHLIQEMSDADFLWRPGKLDDDFQSILAFSRAGKQIVAATCPLLSERLSEHTDKVVWVNGEEPEEMAATLKKVAIGDWGHNAEAISLDRVDDAAARSYWRVVSECL